MAQLQLLINLTVDRDFSGTTCLCLRLMATCGIEPNLSMSSKTAMHLGRQEFCKQD